MVAVFGGMYFVTALPRVAYPYDLDFLEDSVLMQALRFSKGEPVYIAPNADFNPHVYMPLFFWIGGLLLKVGGPSLIGLRLISLVSTLAITGLLFWIGWRESGQWWLGVASAGLYLGGYRINGFWYEIARVDSLFVALLLGGLALAIYAGKSNWRLAGAGALFALAFFTKQTALVVGAGLAVYLLYTLGRRAWVFIGSMSALSLIPMVIFNVLTNGWFFYHVISVGAGEPVELGRLLSFATGDMLGVMVVLSLLAIVVSGLSLRQNGWRAVRLQPWLVAMGLAVIISGLARMRVGGNLNNRMPAYALLCLTPALVWQSAGALAEAGWGWAKVWKRWGEVLVSGAILIQLALGAYNPLRYIPTAEMQASGDRLVARVAALDGPVLVMMHPFYALLAGKEPSTQIATLWYVRKRGTEPLPNDFVARIETGYYTAIISDESSFETEPDLVALIDQYYVRAEVLGEADAPATTTGVVVRPSVVYRPRVVVR
jgi:Dolichyl-phosphate-mannose-protein mannosyltransferase